MNIFNYGTACEVYKEPICPFPRAARVQGGAGVRLPVEEVVDDLGGGEDHRLRDGVGTNGVVTEVPQFPLMNFHRKMWAKFDRICSTGAKCAHLKQMT